MNRNPKNYPKDPPDDKRVRVIKNPSGEKNLQVLGEGGKWITCYSHRNISSELALFSKNIEIPEENIVILLGIGLGYHLKEILKKTGQPVVVVERDEDVFKVALTIDGMSDVLNDPNIFLVIGKDVENSLNEISRIQLQFGLRDMFLVKHPPSIRSFPSFYHPIIERLEVAKKTRIGNKLKYEKFERERLHILLINSQYLMMGELVNAIHILGHKLRTVIVEREAEVARNDFIEEFLKILIEFKPDFVLTINHLGFDREGIVTDLLTTLKIPFASWYVDSPMLIIKHYERNLSPYCTLFLWDEDYISDMRALGFDKVHYLPLAADPHTFRPIDPKKNPLLSQANAVSFVGNSMTNKIQKRMERLEITDEHKRFIEELARAYAQCNSRNVGDILNQEPYRKHRLVQKMQNDRRVDFETLIMWQATQIYRLQYVQMLESFHPTIRGDDGWHKLLNGSFQVGPELSYYHDLNYFYNVSKINFNITSTQMRNAVNQRVFDVPASGGFLLTDYKKQLEALMKVGEEVVCYRDSEEIPELIKFYLKHDTLREKIAQKGRKRVLKEHTYMHRLQELCSYMKRHFA